MWSPFLTSVSSLARVLKRIFPTQRGLFEDYVANFWYVVRCAFFLFPAAPPQSHLYSCRCVSSLVIKWKRIIRPELLFKLCTGTTLLAFLPSVVSQAILPAGTAPPQGFALCLVNSAMAFFMFSYQVCLLHYALLCLFLRPHYSHVLLCTGAREINPAATAPAHRVDARCRGPRSCRTCPYARSHAQYVSIIRKGRPVGGIRGLVAHSFGTGNGAVAVRPAPGPHLFCGEAKENEQERFFHPSITMEQISDAFSVYSVRVTCNPSHAQPPQTVSILMGRHDGFMGLHQFYRSIYSYILSSVKNHKGIVTTHDAWKHAYS